MAIMKKITNYFTKYQYEIMCGMMALTGNVDVDLLFELKNK